MSSIRLTYFGACVKNLCISRTSHGEMATSIFTVTEQLCSGSF